MSSTPGATGKTFEAWFEVYSPRWGHTDRYLVRFLPEEAMVAQGARRAFCRLDENGDTVWEGPWGPSQQAVLDIFAEDRIYAPVIVGEAIASAWQRWRESAVDDQTLRQGLDELFRWVDSTAQQTPGGPLWGHVF